MIITINLKKLSKANITPNEVFYLIGLYQNEPVTYYQDLTNLEKEGYIKRFIDEETSLYSIVLREPALKLLKTLSIDGSANIEIFVKEYRDLFPIGVKTGGQPVRGDKADCIAKMKDFKRKYDFTNEEILEATRVYLTIKKKESYKFTQTAHSYILKDGISSLAAMCEDIRLNGTKSNIDKIEGIGTTEGI